MAKNTKERILEAALEIFARDGYTGTNIKDIAESVGIVKSALYRHFESKEEIWDAVFNKMATYYKEHFGSLENLPEIPQNVEELYDLAMRMINFTVHDNNIIRMRKIIITEQFRDEKVCRLATDYFLNGTEVIFTKIFDEMMKNGSLKECNPQILAFSFTSPITSLIHFCDREPEKKEEAMEKASRFIRYFIETNKA